MHSISSPNPEFRYSEKCHPHLSGGWCVHFLVFFYIHKMYIYSGMIISVVNSLLSMRNKYEREKKISIIPKVSFVIDFCETGKNVPANVIN